MPKPQIVQAPCNDCGRKTDHLVLKRHVTSGADEETWWETTFEMLECRGCHFISLKRTFQFSEYNESETEYFPPPVSRRKPSWLGELMMNIPTDLEIPDLLDETYTALHANNRRLTAMGARALLDMTIVHSVGDVGTFKEKLAALLEKQIIGPNQLEFLEAALDAGNAAAHRGHCPSAKQLNQVMDIVENVLQQIYVLPHAAAQLRKAIPKRNKGSK